MAIQVSARTAGLVVAAALAGMWYGTTVTVNVAREQASRVPRDVRPVGSAVPMVPRADRLRERRIEAPSPGAGRNPFVYGSRAPRATTVRDRAAEPAAPPAMPEPPPLPVFRLSGIASDTKDGATVRTAIIIDNGTMVFARDGDRLSNGYSVVKVEEMSVTLVDSSGVTETIRLP